MDHGLAVNQVISADNRSVDKEVMTSNANVYLAGIYLQKKNVTLLTEMLLIA